MGTMSMLLISIATVSDGERLTTGDDMKGISSEVGEISENAPLKIAELAIDEIYVGSIAGVESMPTLQSDCGMTGVDSDGVSFQVKSIVFEVKNGAERVLFIEMSKEVFVALKDSPCDKTGLAKSRNVKPVAMAT